MPAITSYAASSLTAREFIRLAHGGACVYAANYGVTADGTTDDTAALQAAVDAAFGPYSAPLARENYRMLVLPRGVIKITSAIALSRGLNGGMIVGQGRFATQIQQVTTGASALVTNGCQYSWFGNFYVRTEGGVCFDLDYDNSGTNGCALQSNTFANIFFDAGDNTATNAQGIRISNTGFMGSENLILNCFWIRCKEGVKTLAFNALQNTVLGGNFQLCQWGIYAGSGSVTLIDSVGFQQSTQYDIEASASANDTMVINACRTESLNFCKPGSQGAIVTGCTQSAVGSGGYFFYAPNNVCSQLVGNQISGTGDVGGKVLMGSGGVMESNRWTNPDSDILDRVTSARVITIENHNLVSGRTARGWGVGKYIHNTDIPNGTVRWNHADKDSAIQVYGDDYCFMQDTAPGNSIVRATTSKSSGKWYWEAYMHFESSSNDSHGVANSTLGLTTALGETTNGIGYLGDGRIRYNATNLATVSGWGTGDTISIALDKDNNKLWVRVNGGNWNNSGSDNPATNTGGVTISVTGALFPAGHAAEDGASQVLVPQSRRWKYAAPSGFSELT